MPTLRGEINWCQLFSEPGAGSDLAGALDAREARSRAAGSLNGQKVWTSMAKEAEWGILPRAHRRPTARSTKASPASWST